MRMDGIVITEWRYPHSVKLEKAGRKPPTGKASKERVVVMVIGEFKQGFANLQGKRCKCVREFVLCVCVCVCVVVIWDVFADSFCEQGEKSCGDLDEDSTQWGVFNFKHTVLPELILEVLVKRFSIQIRDGMYPYSP